MGDLGIMPEDEDSDPNDANGKPQEPDTSNNTKNPQDITQDDSTFISFNQPISHRSSAKKPVFNVNGISESALDSNHDQNRLYKEKLQNKILESRIEKGQLKQEQLKKKHEEYISKATEVYGEHDY